MTDFNHASRILYNESCCVELHGLVHPLDEKELEPEARKSSKAGRLVVLFESPPKARAASLTMAISRFVKRNLPRRES